MTQVETASTITPPATRRVGILGVVIVMALLVIGLAWAKWLPYSDKIAGLADTRSWPDGPIFGAAGEPGSIPTISGAWQFWTTYVSSVWKAALVALVVAAAIEALVPKQWLTRLLDRRHTINQSALGGLLSLPSMMCTCCTAPVAVSLRRNGAPLAASLAYWVGNPLLNPAVIVFLALTLPWEYAAVRVAIGALVVVGGSALVASRLARPASEAETRVLPMGGHDDAPVAVREMPARFLKTLLRYAVILVPEYAAIVLLTGLLSGWLSDFAGLDAASGPLALLIVGLIGAALVIPTGGEVPAIVGLIAAGASADIAGTLLIALPAVSLPSMVMVARTLSWRGTLAMTGVVVAGAVAAGLALAVMN